jgi:hypothetical protein
MLVLESTVSAAPAGQLVCFDYRYRLEERANPQLPGQVLITRDTGRICTGSGTDLIVLSYSERHVKDRPVDQVAYGRLLEEQAKPFFDSLIVGGSTSETS